ncbi:BPL-N domain-containing protein [Hahella sp. CR1]|uniref:BPL-N domain-containing protein n=1 Tax=Hahella sp. CR1 TaxID=2992807 RepID=UPI0024420C89|nr:BPL-N domain-containing protein [Hahella sp. CR1]MDG9669587.1 BPL-N domain-containing protein [Hahella sp. CR1]
MKVRSYKTQVGLPLQLFLSSLLFAGHSAADKLTNEPIPPGEGFYKDVLINAGPGVSAPPVSHFDSLGLSYEQLSYKAYHEEDKEEFKQKFIGSDIDLNGRLLYPDGAPRYRMLSIGKASFLAGGSGNGGGGYHSQVLHDGLSPLRRTGVQHIQDFVKNGGGYVGFCAGAIIAGSSPFQLSLYPGKTYPLPDTSATVNLKDLFTDYLGFGEVPNVWSKGGGYIMQSPSSRYPYNYQYPEGVEIQGVAAGHPAIWSWKDPGNPYGGTLVLSGRHPELSHDPRAKPLTEAMYTLAIRKSLDENYEPKVRIKGELENGQIRYMHEETGYHDPSYIKIGDKQYHHFKFRVDDDRKKYLSIELNREQGYRFNLYLKKDKPAFASNADKSFIDVGLEDLAFDNLSEGEWYLSVENATTVDTIGANNTEYSGELGVLNGVAYDLTATWGVEEPCDSGIGNVSFVGPVVPGQNLPISWNAECFEPGRRATVALVRAGDEMQVATISRDGGLNDGLNRLNWSVTYNQPGLFKVGVRDNQNPNIMSLSEPFAFKQPEMVIVPPVSSGGERLSIIWFWRGIDSRVSLDLYVGDTLISNLHSGLAQESGANSILVMANWSWNPQANYRVRFKTLDLDENKVFYSPIFKPSL